MHDPLHRLYRAKLAILATLLLLIGLALLVFGHAVQSASGWGWLHEWPIIDIGSAAFTTGLLGVAWQYLDGQDSEARDTERLQRVVSASVPAMRDAVIRGFAFDPDDIAQVATPAVLDKIITNGLALRTGDQSFAAELYQSVQTQVISAPERLHDARVSIRLSMDSSTPKRRADHFVTTVRWEYTVTPAFAARRFICTADLAEFRDHGSGDTATSSWYLGQRSGLDAGAKSSFEVLDVSADGVLLPTRRTTRVGSQTYTAALPADAVGRPIRLAYTYRTLTRIDDHVLRVRNDRPTDGLTVEFDYGDTTVEHVSVIEFLGSARPATVSRSSPELPERTVGVQLDGWSMPRSGVAFVWSAEGRA